MVPFPWLWKGGCRIIRPSSGGRDAPLEGREQKALWGCAEACRGGLLFMLFLLLSPRPPQWISHGPTLGPALESVIPPFCQLMLHCSAERQNAFLLLLFPFFHPSHLSWCFPSAARYPRGLCGPFRCGAGWRHADQHGKSDNWEWRLHGALWSPEDDGR